jgi:hypothetical protein
MVQLSPAPSLLHKRRSINSKRSNRSASYVIIKNEDAPDGEAYQVICMFYFKIFMFPIPKSEYHIEYQQKNER